MNAITVPAQLVGPLRSGLHSEVGTAAETIAQVVDEADREQHPEWYREPLEQLDRARALLDLIGWSTTDQAKEVLVDLREHHGALSEALRVAMIVGDADLEEAEAVDAERATRSDTPEREATTRRVLALREFVAFVEARADELGEPQR